LRRKDLKRPDAVITVTARAAQWIRAHRPLALGVASALGLVAVGGGAVAAYQTAQRRDANADLGRAMAGLREGPSATAVQNLSEAARRWEGTTPGLLAAALAANTELRLGNPESAAATLATLESARSELPGYLGQQLSYASAATLESQARWREAAAAYQTAAGASGPYTALALLGEARVREQTGEVDRARELYRRCYEQFPDLPGREVIRIKAGL
jgi:tetratricopeptide (TPR) repeat protein